MDGIRLSGSVDEGLYSAYASTHAGIKDRRAEAGMFREQVLPHLPRALDSRILELGCGQGELLRLAQSLGYARSEGVDRSEEQVAIARQNGVSGVSCSDVADVLAKSAVLDCVIAFDFLEHFSRDDGLALLSQVAERLNDGGTLLLRTPNGASPLGPYYQFGDLTHHTFYTPRSMQQAARLAGFRQARFLSCPPPIRGIKSRVRRSVIRSIGAVWTLQLIAETGRVSGHIVTANFVSVLTK
jgi:SAM-dependent methyltransferase